MPGTWTARVQISGTLWSPEPGVSPEHRASDPQKILKGITPPFLSCIRKAILKIDKILTVSCLASFIASKHSFPISQIRLKTDDSSKSITS